MTIVRFGDLTPEAQPISRAPTPGWIFDYFLDSRADPTVPGQSANPWYSKNQF
jgi:hypothetical protein